MAEAHSLNKMSHCSKTLPSYQHPIQLKPPPKKATNIFGLTFLLKAP